MSSLTGLEERINELERDARKKLLRISGLPKLSDAELKSSSDRKTALLTKFLQLSSSVDIKDVNAEDINSCYIVKVPSEKQPDCLMLEFRSEI